MPANCRDLLATEDSVDHVAPPVPPSLLTWVPRGAAPGRWEMQLVAGTRPGAGWDNISRALYNSWIRNGATGARRLDLPIVDVSAGTHADRPDPPAARRRARRTRHAVRAALLPAGQRCAILLSDTAAEITNLPTRRRATPPVDLATLVPGATAGYDIADCAADRASDGAAGYRRVAGGTPLRHRLHQDRAPAPAGVVGRRDRCEILNLGIAGRNLSTGVLNTPDVATSAPATSRSRTPSSGCSASATCRRAARRAASSAGRRRVQPAVAEPAGDRLLAERRSTTRAKASRRGDRQPGRRHRCYSRRRHALRRARRQQPASLVRAAPPDGAVGRRRQHDEHDRLRRLLLGPSRQQNAAGRRDRRVRLRGHRQPASARPASRQRPRSTAGEDFNGNGVLDVYGGTPHLAAAPRPSTTPRRSARPVSAAVARRNPPRSSGAR